MPDNKGSKPNNKNSKTISKIKSSVWDRSFSLTKLSVKAGATALKESILSLKNKTDDDPLWKNIMKEHAGTISRELGELKGSLMKAGQMMSMYGEYFLPPETNEVLKSLQSDSPPVAFEYIENIIRQELGDEKLNELEIENQSWATASLGQVHRAKIKSTQEWIVLKVQYPRIEEAIDSDVAALKRILQIMKLLPKEMAFESVFTEIKEMLHFETDYNREADFTEKFAKLLEQDQRYVVPRVYRRYSTKKILATSFERGIRADDPIIKSLPQDRRNRLAEAFLDLYFKELFQWRQMQTDPHAGNYRIRVSADGKDQIVLFDFGATREFPESFMNPYYRMIQASLRGDNDAFNQAATELKFIFHNDDPQLKDLFTEFCFQMIEPFLEPHDSRNPMQFMDAQGHYDFKKTTLPTRVTQKAWQIIKTFKWRSPPREIIFLDRKTGGVFIFLALMEAKFPARRVLLPYLSELE